GGHGPFVWGENVEAAVHNAVALEEIARMAYLTVTIAGDAERLSPALRRKHYERKHGAGAYYGQAGKER
ncbi:MAG: class II aldolase/adducin family protein, partial [Alkalispirochaeta sp.]